MHCCSCRSFAGSAAGLRVESTCSCCTQHAHPHCSVQPLCTALPFLFAHAGMFLQATMAYAQEVGEVLADAPGNPTEEEQVRGSCAG